MEKILLIENFSSDFYKSRIHLAKFLKNRGWEVYALVPKDDYFDLICNEGINVIEYNFERKDKGLRQLIRLITIYRRIINEYNFDIIHSFRFQPNLLNVLSNLFNKRKVVLHITGLGIAFSNSSLKYIIFRIISQLILQIKMFRANKIIVQNQNDIEDIWLSELWSKKIHLIKGSGVDIAFFNKELFNRDNLRKSMSIPVEDKIFICVTRLIWEKGIQEMIEAFQSLNLIYPNLKLWIVGWSDKDNPRHIESAFIQSFGKDNNILFLGKKDNIRELLAVSDVFLYPSYYREGIPRSILEALAMSLPIITTDMPGCNLTVVNDKNGYLISPRSTKAIKEAVVQFVNNELVVEMGNASRILCENEFSDTIIFDQISKVYNL